MSALSNDTIVGVVGAGAMGSGIAQVIATAGFKVLLYDSDNTNLDKSKASLKNIFNKLVEKQKLTLTEAENILSKINYVNDITSYKSCGLIIEAIVENLEVKQNVFKQIESTISGNCILASNTSSLSIASIASACEKPDRVLGIHFFNPASLMPLVEVIPSLATDKEIVKAVKELVNSWGKTVVMAKDTPGFIVNRIARPFYGEALRIYEEGFADFATIDWSIKTFGGFKMGPFELMDFIGNDINYKVTETVWEQYFYEPRYKPSLTQKRLFEAKYYGRKSGRGYYNYNEKGITIEPKKNEALGKEIFLRILVMLINEAIDALYLNIATREDIDIAMTKGVNYPKGLLKWADEIGLEKVLLTLEQLQDEYGEERYRPSILLKRMVKEKTNFYKI